MIHELYEKYIKYIFQYTTIFIFLKIENNDRNILPSPNDDVYTCRRVIDTKDSCVWLIQNHWGGVKT